MRKKLSSILAICFLSLYLSTASASDFSVSTISLGGTDFTEDNQKITIAHGGNLLGDGQDPAIFGSNTGLHLIVNANANQGITSTAIGVEIFQGLLSNISLNTGWITSIDTKTVYFLNTLAGTTNINIASGATLSNTNSFGGNAIHYDNGSADANLVITNSGTISTVNSSGSNAIYFADSSGGSTLSITNNSGGSITAGALGTAVNVLNGNSATINNFGTITGAISAVSGDIDITNSGTINGNITLGSNSSSTLKVDGGTLSGNVTLGNSSQIFSVINGGIYSGAISGSGVTKLDLLSTINLNSGTLNSAIDGAADGNGGILVIAANQAVTTNANIGANFAILSLTLNDNAALDLASHNNSVNFNLASLNPGSVLTIGSATLHGNISSRREGTVNFNDNNILGGRVGNGAFAVDAINIAANKTVTGSSYNISADTITLNSGSTLSSSAELNGAISLDSTANLNLGGGAIVSGAIDGLSGGGKGTLNITDGDVIVTSVVGANFKLANIIVDADSDVRFRDDLQASNINYFGDFYLDKIGGNIVVGNITGHSGGLLSLGSGSSTVSGSLTIPSGSSLALTLSSPSASGNITSNGIVTVSSDAFLKLTIGDENNVAKGSTYTIISGATSSSIEAISSNNIFINDALTNRFGHLKFLTSVEGNDLILSSYNAGADGIAKNKNQYNVYDALYADNSATGNLNAMQNYVDQSSNRNAQAAALDSLTPQADNSSNRLSFNNTNNSLNITSQRMAGLRRGISSGDETGRKTVWAQAFGSKINQGNSVDSQGYFASSFGFAGGFDHEIANDMLAGISFSYANSNITSRDNFKKTGVNSYQVNLYSGIDFEKFFLNALVGAAFNKYNSSRTIPVVSTSAHANYSGETYIARIETGKRINLKNDYIFTPTLAITAAHNSIDNYAENGAGTLNLAVANRSTNFFELRPGMELGKDFKLANAKKIHPAIFTSYGYDLAGNKQHTTARFVGQSASFESSGANIAQGSWILGARLKFFHANDFSVNLDYAYEQRTQYSSHSGALKVKYEF